MARTTRKTFRQANGQSLVEYALGLGCVSCVCMAALSSLGFICATIIVNLQSAITYQSAPVSQPGRIVQLDATPWVFR